MIHASGHFVHLVDASWVAFATTVCGTFGVTEGAGVIFCAFVAPAPFIGVGVLVAGSTTFVRVGAGVAVLVGAAVGWLAELTLVGL